MKVKILILNPEDDDTLHAFTIEWDASSYSPGYNTQDLADDVRESIEQEWDIEDITYEDEDDNA